MIRGTTPSEELLVECDIIGWKTYVTIKGLGGQVELTNDRLDMELVEEDGEPMTKVTFRLTQKETLKLKPGKAEVQVRAVQAGNPEDAIATETADITVTKILKEGEIHA